MLCEACDANCATCEDSPTFCLTCKPTSTFLYLLIAGTSSTCVATCPDRMFPDASLDPTTCTDCQSPCSSCTGVGSGKCLSCVSGFYYYQNNCPSTCPTGVAIANPLTHNCDFCDPNCLTCAGTTITCTSCEPTLLLYLADCLTDCPAPLVAQNGTCGPCDDMCQECSGDKFTCTSCDTSSALPYLLNTLCLATCPTNYYEDLGNGICSLCSSVSNLHCTNCESISTCVSCNLGYVLHNQACLDNVPTGFVNISGVAVACTGDCATCSVSTSNCTSCSTNNLLNNACLPNCPTGYIPDNKVCLQCTSPCRTCQTQVDSCLTCVSDLTPDVFLTGDECLQTCPDGTFPNSATNVCASCQTPCEYCVSLTSCTTCLTDFFLEGTTCVATCQQGFAGVSGLCQACVGNCNTCVNDTSLCLTCKASTYLLTVNNTCVTNCGVGLFVNILTQTCVSCEDPCKTCTNTFDTCLSCLTGVMFENTCLDVCPDKYFDQSGSCKACPTNCSSCTGSNSCTTCIDTFVLYTGFCITNCPMTHSVIINSVCTLCSDSNCHLCDSADVCNQCNSDYSLLNGNCLGNCPSGYETNGTHCIDTNAVVLTTSSAFPVPFSIASAVAIIACLMSKLQFSHTFMPGAVYALLGVFEWGALAYFLYLYFFNFFASQPLPFFVGAAALAYLYVLNILSLIVQNIVFCYDKHYRQWYAFGPHKCCTVFTNTISALTSHKFRNLLFCKLFTFSVFTAQLDTVSKFRIINIFSFLSLLHSGGAIFAAAVAFRYTKE